MSVSFVLKNQGNSIAGIVSLSAVEQAHKLTAERFN